ncbi:MAG: hypothetical protein Q8R92_19345 [Deltaproteobacteria bacterium]|nr:hypothetical protein [Deltaproteobacteria bacterium]
MKVGPRPARRRGLAAIALGLAALLAFLTVDASALHQHGGEAGAAQFDCRGCAWTHAVNGVLGHAPRIVASIDAAALPWTTVRLDVPSLFPTQRTTRGPPSLSL